MCFIDVTILPFFECYLYGFTLFCFVVSCSMFRDRNLVPRPEHGSATGTWYRDTDHVPRPGPGFDPGTRTVSRHKFGCMILTVPRPRPEPEHGLSVTVAEPVFIICLVPYPTVPILKHPPTIILIMCSLQRSRTL